jgi:hypothetical protein
MLYRILADLVVLLHLLFIIFVVAGGLLVLFRAWLALLHLPALIWSIYIEFSGKICPLTPLENSFSRLAGDAEYSTSFIDHYLIPVVYPAGLTREVQIFLGLLVIVINLAVYSFVLRRYVNRREDKKIL